MVESDFALRDGYPIMPEEPVAFARAVVRLGGDCCVWYVERLQKLEEFAARQIARFLYGASVDLRYSILAAFHDSSLWNEVLDAQLLHIVGEYHNSSDKHARRCAALAASRALRGLEDLRPLLEVCSGAPLEPQPVAPLPKPYVRRGPTPAAVYEAGVFSAKMFVDSPEELAFPLFPYHNNAHTVHVMLLEGQTLCGAEAGQAEKNQPLIPCPACVRARKKLTDAQWAEMRGEQ